MHSRRLKFTASILAALAALLLFGVSRQPAFAALVECRGDPVVVLSDGTLVDVSATIDTPLWNVKQVHYTLHIPRGLSPTFIIRTKAWLTSQESFTIYSDNAAHAYSSATTVQTQTSDIAVTASMLVNLGYGQRDGVTGQTLKIDLTDN